MREMDKFTSRFLYNQKAINVYNNVDKKIKENRGMSLIIFTVILAVLVVIAGGVIVYLLSNPKTEHIKEQTGSTTLFNTPNTNSYINNSNSTKNNSNDMRNESEKEITYAEIQGEYFYETSHPEYKEIGCYFKLSLSSDGTFDYMVYEDNAAGFCGNYIMNGSEIVLNKLFDYGSDVGLNVASGQIKLKINDDGTINDSNKYDMPISNITLKRGKKEISESLKEHIKSAVKNNAFFSE